jgi:hypothetical protein
MVARVVVTLIALAGLAATVWSLIFLGMMAHGFGFGGAGDRALFVGTLLACIYFAGAMLTAMPGFPISALAVTGILLHLVLMPVSVLLICFALGARQAFYLLPGGAFAVIWFFMARSIAERVA